MSFGEIPVESLTSLNTPQAEMVKATPSNISQVLDVVQSKEVRQAISKLGITLIPKTRAMLASEGAAYLFAMLYIKEKFKNQMLKVVLLGGGLYMIFNHQKLIMDAIGKAELSVTEQSGEIYGDAGLISEKRSEGFIAEEQVGYEQQEIMPMVSEYDASNFDFYDNSFSNTF